MITPQEQYLAFAQALGHTDLYLKREDKHPYGSHKGRSIPLMVDHYYKQGSRRFAITGSGNASYAAALHIKNINSEIETPTERIDLDIFVGANIEKAKFDRLKMIARDSIRILIKERPLQALSQAVQEGATSLRQSTDDIALVGYESLAQELAEIENLGAIFMGTSSGTTAQALAQYFAKINKPVQIHIIQTSSCHPMFDAFEAYGGPTEQSIAGAIVDHVAQRRDALIPLIKNSGGHGWSASNDQIVAAQSLVKTHTKLDISTNAALSIVGAMQASYASWEIKGTVVCILGGE